MMEVRDNVARRIGDAVITICELEARIVALEAEIADLKKQNDELVNIARAKAGGESDDEILL